MRIRLLFVFATSLFIGGFAPLVSAEEKPLRIMENLGRGVVAINRGDDVFVSWRLLGTEPQDIAFNVYRSTGDAAPRRINEKPLTGGTNLIDTDADLSQSNAYFVRAVIDGVEQPDSGAFVLQASPPARQYLEIPLRPLPSEHYVHLAWVGDLDGDGEYDYIVDRLPSGEGGPRSQKLDAYASDGTFLWRVDFGPDSINTSGSRWNSPPATISNGHNDGVTVYDLDLDGRAEVIIKSARNVVFGDGQTLDEGDDIQQFISVLDGQTGAEIARAPVPRDLEADGPVGGHFGIMYLDGQRPSVVFKAKNRRKDGGFNLMSNTWTLNGSKLTHAWKWIRTNSTLDDYHQIRIVDVDGDGCDELCDGSFVINNDGALLYNLEGVVHGDRFHISDLDPKRPGLEGFGVQQNNPSKLHLYYYDAANGKILRKHFGQEKADIGRGIAADIDPRYQGYEYWAFSGIYNAATGKMISPEPKRPWPNFRIWWDGDALSENLNRTIVEKWEPKAGEPRRLFSAHRDGAIDSWRDAPVFYGDILGDWREEVVFEHGNHDKLMVFTTTSPTDIRLYTLPHNPMYRASMTVKGYMQSHMVDYYLGHGMVSPSRPRITTLVRDPEGKTAIP